MKNMAVGSVRQLASAEGTAATDAGAASTTLVNHAWSFPVLLSILTFLVFFVSPITETSDAMFSLVVSEGILLHGSTHLNWLKATGEIDDGSTPPISANNKLDGPQNLYQLGRVHGNIVYRYPNGGSILAVPFVALANVVDLSPVKADGSYYKGGEFVIQRLIAALLMGILVGLVFCTANLLLDFKTSTLIALGFALATPVWSEATRQLWSQTWLIFLEGFVVYILLNLEARRGRVPAYTLATLLSWMYFARPTGAVSVMCVSAYILIFYRRAFPRLVATGALWLALFALYNWLTFGELIPGYYRSRLDFSHAALSVTSNLIGPSRGLFVYVPVLAFIGYLLLRYWKAIPSQRLAWLSIAAVSLHVVVLAGYPCWWGGACYGARLMLDVFPWIVLLTILACAGAAVQRPRPAIRYEGVAAAILLLISIGMNARGATSWDCVMWNWEADVSHHPERILDWSYPQFAAGISPAPAYAAGFEEKLKQRDNTVDKPHAATVLP